MDKEEVDDSIENLAFEINQLVNENRSLQNSMTQRWQIGAMSSQSDAETSALDSSVAETSAFHSSVAETSALNSSVAETSALNSSVAETSALNSSAAETSALNSSAAETSDVSGIDLSIGARVVVHASAPSSPALSNTSDSENDGGLRAYYLSRRMRTHGYLPANDPDPLPVPVRANNRVDSSDDLNSSSDTIPLDGAEFDESIEDEAEEAENDDEDAENGDGGNETESDDLQIIEPVIPMVDLSDSPAVSNRVRLNNASQQNDSVIEIIGDMSRHQPIQISDNVNEIQVVFTGEFRVTGHSPIRHRTTARIHSNRPYERPQPASPPANQSVEPIPDIKCPDARPVEKKDKACQNATQCTQDEKIHLQCAVCLESAVRKSPHSTSCGHIFCKYCIQTAINLTRKCPLCNKALNMKKIHPIYLS